MLSMVEHVGERKRCWKEGEAVLNAGHILMCGIKSKTDEKLSILALCAQTSSLRGKPHEVLLELSANSFAVVCSCKAGNSSRCKHCIAVLMHVNR